VIAEIAREWHGRVPMAVASNGQRRNVEATLRVTKLLPLFDCIVGAEDVAHGKPEPDVFLEAARRIKVPPRPMCRLRGFERRAGGGAQSEDAGNRCSSVLLAAAVDVDWTVGGRLQLGQVACDLRAGPVLRIDEFSAQNALSVDDVSLWNL
jgi:hypothetical protein